MADRFAAFARHTCGWAHSGARRASLATGQLLAGMALVFTLFCIVASAPAKAWGRLGHEAVAYTAERLLQPRALLAVRWLAGPGGLVPLANVADEIVPTRRDTGPLHFVNIDIQSTGYDAARDCPQSACLPAALAREIERLGDACLSRAERREALLFVVHLMADLHQPLHVADNGDRGGNDLKVRLGDGAPQPLHRVWDLAVVEALGGSAPIIGSRLRRNVRTTGAADLVAIRAGGILAWLDESWRTGRDAVYTSVVGGGTLPRPADPSPLLLPPDYASRQSILAQRQLLRAALRLAATLDSTLDRPLVRLACHIR